MAPQTVVRSGAIALVLLGVGVALADDTIKSPVRVTIKDEKTIATGPSLPVDPAQHLQLNPANNMMFNITVDGKQMMLGFLQTMFHIDGQATFPGNFPGRMVMQNQPLPRKPGGTERRGVMSVYEVRNMTVTHTIEVVPTKPHGGFNKRRMDAVLVRFDVENKDSQPHKFGVRQFMDVFLVNNDGALFAAPNKPGKILNGVELKGKDVPDYVQILQVPNLQNPGYVAHLTYNLGHSIEKPSRVILTSLFNAFIDQWNMRVMQANGDSAMGFFWDPKDIPAKGKRVMAYGYGEGVCPNLEGEGQMSLVLGGSFEPGKIFTVAAYVLDPSSGQALTLELPPGMARVEGKERQPVPPLSDDGDAMVLWKARVLRTGEFPVRVRSSTGVTQTKVISISAR
jgi:hypothetical protein